MTFKTISDETYRQAGAAIRASEGQPYEEYDSAHLVAAGAALVLERGEPHLLTESYKTEASDYLNQGSRSWRLLHGAVARFIEEDMDRSGGFDFAGDGVAFVVSDVLQRASAQKINLAVRIPELSPILDESEKMIATMASSNRKLAVDLHNIQVGSFDLLSPDSASSLKEALDTPLSGETGKQAELIGNAINRIVIHLDNFDDRSYSIDGAMGNFEPVSHNSRHKVFEFHTSGISTGSPSIDQALTLLSDQHPESKSPVGSPELFTAQARLIDRHLGDTSSSPSALATMVLSDAGIMKRASASVGAENLVFLNPRGEGEYHLLPKRERETIERHIIMGSYASPFDRIRLELAVMENEERERSKNLSSDIDPVAVREVSDNVLNLLDSNRAMRADDSAFIEMDNLANDHRSGKLDARSFVQSAADFAQTLDDRGLSKSPEWEALSRSVDKALGLGTDQEKTTRAQNMAALARANQMAL